MQKLRPQNAHTQKGNSTLSIFLELIAEKTVKAFNFHHRRQKSKDKNAKKKTAPAAAAAVYMKCVFWESSKAVKKMLVFDNVDSDEAVMWFLALDRNEFFSFASTRIYNVLLIFSDMLLLFYDFL